MGCCKEPSSNDNSGPEWNRLTYTAPETSCKEAPRASDKGKPPEKHRARHGKTREAILNLLEKGLSVKAIAALLEMRYGTVYTSIDYYKKTGYVDEKNQVIKREV